MFSADCTAIGRNQKGDILKKHDQRNKTNLQNQKPVLCASCHSSPHAMVPTSQQADNYQALQYQGKTVPMADCAACHRTSKGGGNGNLKEYMETHGGTQP
jgi:hypothetical protein